MELFFIFALQNQKCMSTLQQSIHSSDTRSESKVLGIQRFFTWCRSQEKNRIAWLAITITAHGCIVTPITLIAIIMSGNHLLYWFLAMAAMGSSLVTNLAALPTKITIPVFLLSLSIDLFIIINCLVAGFNITATYQ